MIIKLNTYNLLTNILFHHGKCVQLLFWLVCFALEKTASALAESVNLRLDPQKSYEGGVFFFSYFDFQMRKKPDSSAFHSLGNSCSSFLLKCVSDDLIKSLGATLVLSSPIFQGYFLPTPTGWESQSWNRTRSNYYHVRGVKEMFWPVLILMPLDLCVLQFLDTQIEDIINCFIPSSHVHGNWGTSENDECLWWSWVMIWYEVPGSNISN